MRLNSIESLAGFPVLKVRDALRRMPFFNEGDIVKALNTSSERAAVLIAELGRRGWCRHTGHSDTWEICDEGMQFLAASAARPISRRRANELLAAVIERADAFEHSFPDWPIRLTRLGVFGSFLTEAPSLGDLDVAVDVKKMLGDDFESALHDARGRAEADGFRAHSKFERLLLPELFVYHKLKARNRSISLHSWSDLVSLGCPYKTIWGDRPSDSA